jgi:hypothetical protein
LVGGFLSTVAQNISNAGIFSLFVVRSIAALNICHGTKNSLCQLTCRLTCQKNDIVFLVWCAKPNALHGIGDPLADLYFAPLLSLRRLPITGPSATARAS